jgi:trehalose synthase-fused probable maltokinase
VPENHLFAEMLSNLRQSLPAQLPSFLTAQRWFGGKARQILGVPIIDAIPIDGDERKPIVLVVAVKYSEGSEETYSIPLIAAQVKDEGGSALRLSMGDSSGLVFRDAFSNQEFLAELLDIIEREREIPGDWGRLCGFRTVSFSKLVSSPDGLQPKLLTGEQSNSSVIYGQRLILKFFRRVEQGENPDLEIGRFLTERARFPHIPRIGGFLQYQSEGGKSTTQAILQEFVPNQGDAWRYTVKILTAFYERVQDAGEPEIAQGKLPEFSGEPMGRLLAEVGLLGKRTAELHLALSAEKDDPAFVPEPFTTEFQNSLEASFADLASGTLHLLRARMTSLPAEYKQKSAEIVARQQEIISRFRTALSIPIEAMRTRIHGDYHLGQVLYTGSDFVIIDFEGEPARPLAERRVKQSPLQDVAGMLRSFHYAAFAPLLTPPAGTSISPARINQISRWAESWSRCAASHFLAQYYETSGAALYIPADSRARAKLLEMYLLAKAIYELGYELNNRPAWVGIPLEGISALLSS